MKLLGSNLVTIPGLFILAAGSLITAYFGYSALEALFIAAFILCLIAFLWAKFALKGIKVSISEEDCCAFSG